MTPEDRAIHLESAEVASYLDRALPPAERERVEAHLADCAECRREVIEVSRLRHTSASRRRWLLFAPAAAAAAILIAVLARPADTPGPGPVLRDGGEEPSLTVSLVAPTDSATVEGRAVAFTWRSAGDGVSYRLTVTDDWGDVVWSGASADTTARLPSTSLRTGRPYFWYVDALLPDGRSMTSNVRRFTAGR
jgi:hypothetical protein